MQQQKLPLFVTKARVALLIIALIASVFIAGYAVGRLTTQKTLGTNANLVTTVNLSLYPDVATNQQLLNITWGIILPTQVLRYTVWIQNDAQIPLNISVWTRDWVPDWAAGNFTFATAETSPLSPNPVSWENQGFGIYPVLNPLKRAPLYLTLTASENATSSAINFVIVFQGDSV